MGASHELNFAKLIYKRLYVVLCCTRLTIYWLFLFFFLYRYAIMMVVTMVLYQLFKVVVDGIIDRFSWLLSQSLFAPFITAVQLRCENYLP